MVRDQELRYAFLLCSIVSHGSLLLSGILSEPLQAKVKPEASILLFLQKPYCARNGKKAISGTKTISGAKNHLWYKKPFLAQKAISAQGHREMAQETISPLAPDLARNGHPGKPRHTREPLR
jgi:hypothetical protein